MIPPAKLTEYLLSDTHPYGAPKAGFFRRFGFGIENWSELSHALLIHAAEHDIVGEEATPFGTRFVIEGVIAGADGRSPNVRAVWFIDEGYEVPRFVTAYPLKGTSDD